MSIFCVVCAAPSYNVNTLAGPIVPVMNDDAEKTITVDMGPPILDGPTVPTTLEPNSDDNSVVEQTLECNGKEWKVSAVSMGNPHAIIFVDDLEKDAADFQREKLKLVQRLDTEKQEFCIVKTGLH